MSGRVSMSTAELDLSAWPPTSLLRKAVLHQVDVWKLNPPDTSKVGNLRNAIVNLNIPSTEFLNRNLDTLTREDVGALLQRIDENFADPSFSSNTVADKYYFAIRGVLTKMPGTLSDGLTFAQAASAYILNGRRWRKPQLPSAKLPPGLGHISHTDLVDLRKEVERSLQERKRSIEQGVASEIKAYEDVFALQTKLAKDLPEASVGKLIGEWILFQRAKDPRPLPACVPLQFASVMLRRLADHPPQFTASGWPMGLRLPKSKLDWGQLPQAPEYRHQFSFWPWFFVRERLPNSVLTSIFILLLSHTGWNQGAVGSLTLDSISALPDGGYILQGYKGKTDDQTPVSEIPRYMKLLCKAIDLLLWNYHQLEHLGLINTTAEKRMWFGWQRDDFKTTLDVISETRIQAFCESHGIERFQPSELRPIKAALTYLPQRDLEAVRVLLGHVDLSTSDTYLESTLFFRLNEAMMLEFQKRIEASLTYAQGGEQLVARRSLSSRHVDSKLLVPTGDGGACANFFDGPKLMSAETEEPCAALACQSGNGCKHYRLVVDETTLEMAMRSRLYYRAHWLPLYEINPSAFSEMHLPRLLYIHVLLKLMKEQRPDLYAKAETALA